MSDVIPLPKTITACERMLQGCNVSYKMPLNSQDYRHYIYCRDVRQQCVKLHEKYFMRGSK